MAALLSVASESHSNMAIYLYQCSSTRQPITEYTEQYLKGIAGCALAGEKKKTRKKDSEGVQYLN